MLRTGAITYTAALISWFILWWLYGDATWWLMALNRYAPYLFAPAPLLLGLFFGAKRWLWFLLVPITLFGGLYGPILRPPTTPSDTALTVRVLNFNVLYSNEQADAIVALVDKLDPDLLALQEVTPTIFDALQVALATNYPWSRLGPVHPYGSTAIFSRHPVREFQTLDLQADRAAVVANVTVDNQPLILISTHLLAFGLQWVPRLQIPDVIAARTDEQRQQAAILAHFVQAQPGTVILACDCNTQITNDTHRVLEAVMDDSTRPSVGQANGLTPVAATVDQRLDRLEYFFHQGALTPISVYVITEMAGSDHHPLVADYAFGE